MLQVLEELQPYTEAWAGMELTPHIAYGFRLYQNSSVLNMHVDKKQTHIVSMIYHIDSSDDSEPWVCRQSSCTILSDSLVVL